MVTLEARPEAVSFDPGRTAVLVVDMQNDFASPGGMFDRAGIETRDAAAAIHATQGLLEAARVAGITIVYLKMEYEPDLSNAGHDGTPNRLKHAPLGLDAGDVLIRATWGTAIVDELAPEPGDVVVSKQRYSGFFDIVRCQDFRRRGITYLVVARLPPT